MLKKAVTRICVLTLAFLLAGEWALAGEMYVNIQQPFKAAGRTFPAGHYRILTDDQNDSFVNIRNLDTKTDNNVPFTTRLSSRGGNSGEIVFDKIDNVLYLAEIYILGTDGYSFQGAPGKHKHVVVKEEPDKYPGGPG